MVSATPRGRLRIAGRSEEALNHPHGSNLSGGKPWLQHQGPRSSTDRCNGGSADGTNQHLFGACQYPYLGTHVRGLPQPPVFFRPKKRGLRQISLGRILTKRCEPNSSQQEQGKSQMALHLSEPTTMASTVAHPDGQSFLEPVVITGYLNHPVANPHPLSPSPHLATCSQGSCCHTTGQAYQAKGCPTEAAD